jgi:hypothetical protein
MTENNKTFANSKHKSEQPLVGKGLLFSHDERDKQYLMFANKPQINDTIRQSWKIGNILNQGSTSQCVGYSWSQFMQSSPFLDLNLPQITPQEIYSKAQKIDEWDGEEPDSYGTSIRAGAKILKELGLIKDYVWGYSVEDIAKFIYENGPVVVGSNWYSSMSNPDQNGFARPIATYEGGHAWLIYGVDCQWETFFGVNSWGTQYGKNGRFFVKFSDMEKLLLSGAQACSALR